MASWLYLLPPSGNHERWPGGNPLPLFISNPNSLDRNQSGGEWSPTVHESLRCSETVVVCPVMKENLDV